MLVPDFAIATPSDNYILTCSIPTVMRNPVMLNEVLREIEDKILLKTCTEVRCTIVGEHVCGDTTSVIIRIQSVPEGLPA